MDESIAAIYLPSRQTRLSRPLIMWRISAGFPSPAEDCVEGRIDLNRDLIKHPLATFYIKVTGDSMEPRIHEGALLVVDRMVEAKEGDIIVARIGHELCVKKLFIEEDGSVWLLSENPAYPPIQITEEMDFEAWGRVMNSIDFL
ncbi:MAG: S24 family peptidase [Acidobacteria bacterium]|nr:S24 family peptidase [Acidobacteriota bacterium]